MYIEYSSQIKQSVKSVIRTKIRSLALDVLSLNNKNSLLKKPRIQFLYFHHIFKNEEKKLADIIKSLSKHHSFLSHSEAIKKLGTGDIDKPYLSFSSDDGFKNNLKCIDIFNDYNISCCFFICPQFIGLKETAAISKTKFHLPPIEFLTWEDVDILKKNGHEIGSHTMNHLRLSEITNQQIIEELTISKEAIETKLGKQPIHFAYPYGLKKDISNFALETVNNLGYASCSSAIRGAYTNKVDITKELILRDQVIFNWKQSHINYFLQKNIGSREQ